MKKSANERKQDFIDKSKLCHGDKYDYSKVDYINNKTPVTIICPLHGEFTQIPSNHYRGKGCPECSGNRRITTEKFITDAIKVHGDKYDYSKVDYIDSKTKVTIICPIHGDFQQTYECHVDRGHDCPRCSGSLVTEEDFLERSRLAHGDKYDYSKVDYVNSMTPVTIICPVHGEFKQKPKDHMDGHGCHKCGGGLKLTVSDFIQNSIKVHGHKYDYSKVNYVNNSTPVTIICPDHGEFEQLPANHMKGHGCPECSGCKKRTTDDFIREAKEVHGDKYDYSLVNYTSTNSPVRIICPIHGVFEQKPGCHLLRGQGCPECSGTKKLTTEEFIQKSIEVHGNEYDYSLVDYVNSKTPVKIICQIHGVFEVTPDKHIYSKCGCPDCNENQSKLEAIVKKLLIDNNINFIEQKSWDWLVYKNKQRLDFYLPDHNIAIECQGKQHFEAVDFFGGQEGFEENVKRDKNKLDLCASHNIRIIYFSDLSTNKAVYPYPYPVYEDLDELLKEIRLTI